MEVLTFELINPLVNILPKDIWEDCVSLLNVSSNTAHLTQLFKVPRERQADTFSVIIVRLTRMLLDKRLSERTKQRINTIMSQLIRYLVVPNRVVVPIVEHISVPQYNFQHFSSECHMNASLALLSTCSDFMVLLSEWLNASRQRITKETNVVNNIFRTLCMPYSSVHPYPLCRVELNDMLKLGGHEFNDASDTVKTIIRNTYTIVGSSVKNTLYYYDCTNDLLEAGEETLSFDELVQKYRPTYIIANSCDLTVILFPDSDRHNVARTIEAGGHEYRLFGRVVFSASEQHYRCEIEYGEKYVCADDLSRSVNCTVLNDRLNGTSTVLGYVRVG